MAASGTTIIFTTTAATIAQAAGVSRVTIANIGAASAYLGSSNVATAGANVGYLLAAGSILQNVLLTGGDVIYAVAGTAGTVAVLTLTGV